MGKFLHHSLIIGTTTLLSFAVVNSALAYSGAQAGRALPLANTHEVDCTDPHTGKKIACPNPEGTPPTTTTSSTGGKLSSPEQNAPPKNHYTQLPFITVSTAPYIGEITAFDASDVLNQAGKVNEDLLLLQTRQEMVHDLAAENIQLTRPIVELSGGVEGQLVEATDFDNHSSGDIDLSTAELDIHGLVSSWASTFMAFTFDDSPSSITGTRVPNSRIFLSRGFVNIGNLDVSPIYFTIGQMYLPFGRYYSDMITTPTTQSLARINDRTVVLGYYHNGFNMSIYSYDGSSTTGSDFVFKQGGTNVSYKYAFNDISTVNIGGGFYSNMTDSDGLQNTGRDSDDEFSGFATPTGSNAIKHNVPAGDAHLEFAYGPWHWASEYICATGDASPADLTFNNSGADPQAMHLELERKFPVKDLVMHALIGYDHTWQALAANLPEQSITANLHTSFWKNTIESIEYRHDIDYGKDDTATGSQNQRPDDETIFGTGHSRNIVILQVGAYF